MQYMCLVHIDGDIIGRLSPEEDKRQQRESIAHDDKLRRSGHLVASNALQGPETATVVRVRDGKVSMTDGPYVETKEHLGGFFLIEARDLNEALAIAGEAPVARFGSIEVRPSYELDP